MACGSFILDVVDLATFMELTEPSMTRPLIITMGDPAGVGPELALRGAWWAAKAGVPIAIAGSFGVLQRVASKLSLALPSRILPEAFAAYQFLPNIPVIVDFEELNAASVQPGIVNVETGRASLGYVCWSIDQAVAGNAAAIVTGPIHKEAWVVAGSPFPGHTELLAQRTHAPRHCMMLAAPSIRCALVTVHIGIAEVPAAISVEGILETIELAGDAVAKILQRPPAITVCGLNPHAGEGGLFGNQEEELMIRPAIKLAKQRGWQVTGPLPADTAFIPAWRAKTDVYVCMYHDQGLIPLKAIAFDEAVNITLGLPIIRTSVDHGTALDIAWQGVADGGSMFAAIDLASKLSANRQE